MISHLHKISFSGLLPRGPPISHFLAWRGGVQNFLLDVGSSTGIPWGNSPPENSTVKAVPSPGAEEGNN